LKLAGWWRGIVGSINTTANNKDGVPVADGDHAVVRVMLPQYQQHNNLIPFWEYEDVTYYRATYKSVADGSWQRGGLRIPSKQESLDWLRIRKRVWAIRDTANDTITPEDTAAMDAYRAANAESFYLESELLQHARSLV
jgi:hypothetical protein